MLRIWPAHGEEGLWRVERDENDVFVLDIKLSTLEGLSIVHRLRKKGNDTHVLPLTALHPRYQSSHKSDHRKARTPLQSGGENNPVVGNNSI